MRFTTRILCLAISVFAFSFASLADNAAAKAKAPAAGKVDVAVELSKTMLPAEQYDQMVQAMTQSGLGMAHGKAQQAGNTFDVEKGKPILEKLVRAKFTYKYFMDLNAKTMREKMSEPELKQVLDFYSTPVGKSWLKLTPEIITKTMTTVQADLQKEMPSLVEKMEKKLPKQKALPKPSK